jgi:superfamily II DNA or RNA helicase
MNLELSPLQKNAIEKILSNFSGPYSTGKDFCNCLLNLGVGNGKTRIAVQTIQKIVSKEGFSLVVAPNKRLLETIWKKELDLVLANDYACITKENLNNYFLPSKKIFFPYDRKKVYLTTIKIISTVCKTNDNTSPSSNSIASYIANTKGLKLTVFDEFHHISNGSELLQNAAKKLNSHLMLAMSATPIIKDEKKEMKKIHEILNIRNEYDSKLFLITENSCCLQNVQKEGFIISYSWFREENLSILKENEKRSKQAVERYKLELQNGLNTKLTYTKKNPRYLTTKLEILRALLLSFPEEDKIIIFDNENEILDNLFRENWMLSYHPIIVHGKTSEDKREELYKQFSYDPSSRVLLCSRTMHQEGMNFPEANRCIIFSTNCSLAQLKQQEGRIERRDQKKNIYTYILYDEPKSKSTNTETSSKKIHSVQSILNDDYFNNHSSVHLSSKENFHRDLGNWLFSISLSDFDEETKAKKIIQLLAPENSIELKRLLNESDETDKSVDISYLFSCLKNQQNYEEKRLNDIRDFYIGKHFVPKKHKEVLAIENSNPFEYFLHITNEYIKPVLNSKNRRHLNATFLKWDTKKYSKENVLYTRDENLSISDFIEFSGNKMIIRINNALNTVKSLLDITTYASKGFYKTQLTQDALEGKKRIYQKTKDKIDAESTMDALLINNINTNKFKNLEKYLNVWYEKPFENKNTRDILILLDCLSKNAITDSSFFLQITKSTSINYDTIIKLEELLNPEIILEI